MSFYAGLVPMSGTIGLYGRLLAVGGGVCVLVGLWSWLHPARALERTILIAGSALAAFSIWLVTQLVATERTLQANPMIVPRVGPAARPGAVRRAGGLVRDRRGCHRRRARAPAAGVT